MGHRLHCRGVTLVELVVVLAVIAILVGLLLPAIHYSRESARRIACQGNLHQLGVAMSHYVEVRKQVPDPCPQGTMGGWAIELLPFMEDTNLADVLSGNPPLDRPAALEWARQRPFILTCPSAYDGDSSVPTLPPSHYSAILTTGTTHDRDTSSRVGVGSRSRKANCPWLIGELTTDAVSPGSKAPSCPSADPSRPDRTAGPTISSPAPEARPMA